MASAQNLISDKRETIQQFTNSTFVTSSGLEIKSNHLREYLKVAYSVFDDSPEDDLERFMSLGELFQKRYIYLFYKYFYNINIDIFYLFFIELKMS